MTGETHCFDLLRMMTKDEDMYDVHYLADGIQATISYAGQEYVIVIKPKRKEAHPTTEGTYKRTCPKCGKKTLRCATVNDDEHDEVYETGEFCEDQECGYGREL